MNLRTKLEEDSILQFQGNIPTEVNSICIKYLSEFDVKYLISSVIINDEIASCIEEVLHDVLTNMGVRRDSQGNIIGYRYNIEYEILNSVKAIEVVVKDSEYTWIYRAAK